MVAPPAMPPLSWKRLPRQLAGMALAGIVLALLGPFNTFATMAWPERIAFWVVAVIGPGLLIILAYRVAAMLLPPPRWPLPVALAVGAVVGSVPATFLVRGLLFLMTGQSGFDDLATQYLSVLLVTAVLTAAFALVESGGAVARSASGEEAPPAPGQAPLAPSPQAAEAAFLARHAARLAGARLLALQAEDHYLRIHTDLGSELVLLRLRDALAGLAAVPGLQVHRSFWVADAAVAAVTRQGDKLVLTLGNGLDVPVSRANVAKVRAAGWLERRPIGAPEPAERRVV